MTSKFTVGQKVRITAAYGCAESTGKTVEILSTTFDAAWPIKTTDYDDPNDYMLFTEEELEAAAPTLSDELRLPPQGRTVLNHMRKQGSISAADAMLSYGMTSAVLTRRICDIENIGFNVVRESKKHPTTNRRYTRYSLAA